MVVGDGMLAKAFERYKEQNNSIIFASGISYSNEINISNFLREKKLLTYNLLNHRDKLFVHFSSCSIEDGELRQSPYHVHKRELEILIEKISDNYLIFRLPNIIGKNGNKHTLVNFFIEKIKKHQKFILWNNATRNIVDIEDLVKIISYIIDNNIVRNDIVNIAYNKNIKIINLIRAIERNLEKKAIYTIENKGTDITIDNSFIRPIMKKLVIQQPNIDTLINKYKGV